MTAQQRLEDGFSAIGRSISQALSAAVDLVAERMYQPRAGEPKTGEPPFKTEPKRLMNTAEAAEFLGVSVAMLERDRSVGGRRIPCVRIGKAVRYDRRVLEQRIADGEFAVPAPENRRTPRRRKP